MKPSTVSPGPNTTVIDPESVLTGAKSFSPEGVLESSTKLPPGVVKVTLSVRRSLIRDALRSSMVARRTCNFDVVIDGET